MFQDQTIISYCYSNLKWYVNIKRISEHLSYIQEITLLIKIIS